MKAIHKNKPLETVETVNANPYPLRMIMVHGGKKLGMNMLRNGKLLKKRNLTLQRLKT
jgi:hypothetical protein